MCVILVELPSLIFFLRPSVPNLSHIDSSLFLFSDIGLGDFGRNVAIVEDFETTSPTSNTHEISKLRLCVF